ncbi:MAG: hypothetical protein JWQ74_1341 [Marmoricola sp.]|nr:hypothetical protein [Marmoricola sp.]
MSPKNPKSPKKRSDAASKELKAVVAKLRAELERAEGRVVRLKSKVGVLETTRAELEKQVRKLTKKLDRAKAPTAPEPKPEPAVDQVEPAPVAPASDVPGPTWTVAQLRAEVQARGIEGVSGRATKAQLLAVLAPAPDAL